MESTLVSTCKAWKPIEISTEALLAHVPTVTYFTTRSAQYSSTHCEPLALDLVPSQRVLKINRPEAEPAAGATIPAVQQDAAGSDYIQLATQHYRDGRRRGFRIMTWKHSTIDMRDPTKELHYVAEKSADIQIIYDGDCPLCTSYVKHVRLKRNFSQISLVNARNFREIALHYRDKGMSLDDGMVVKIDTHEYYAADAINVIALLSSSSGAFNRLNALIFRYPRLSKALYPAMRTGRNLLLRLLAKRKIDDSFTQE